MFERSHLARLRGLRDAVRRLQEEGPADEEVGNRLQRAGEELAEIERLLARARSKIAESMRAARGVLRELGIASPPMTRPPGPSTGARPSPEHGLIVYSPTDAGPCLSCGEPVAAGPIGWLLEPESDPLCAECLKQRNGQLALVLELACFFRELGEMDCDSEGEEDQLENFLTAMAGQTEALFLRPVAPQTSLSLARLYELLEKIEERNAYMAAPEAGAG